MYDSHVHLDITEAEWQAFMHDLRDCFAKFKIQAQEQGELVAIVESTKKDIVLKKRAIAEEGSRTLTPFGTGS